MTARVLLVAGHNAIESIGQDGLCAGLDKAATVAKLRGSTGSHGEREWTGSLVQLLADALRHAGVDAAATDAIYHTDVYSAGWDLVLECHYHRDAPTERAMAAAPDPAIGFVEAAAQRESQRFVERWASGYQRATGIPITQQLVTLNMSQLYSFCYVPTRSAAACLEFGNADVDAAVLYEPGIARIVRFTRDCVLEHLNIPIPADPPPARRASDVPPPAPPAAPPAAPPLAHITVLEAAARLREIAAELEAV